MLKNANGIPILTQVWEHWTTGTIVEIMDPSLRGKALLVENVSGRDEHYNSSDDIMKKNDSFGQTSGFLSPIFNVPSMTITRVLIGGGSPTRSPIYTILPSNG